YYYGPFLTSNVFGVPEADRAAGIEPVCPTVPGWDAQFYYFQSNDLSITSDAQHHIDNPSYRYQRVGMPLLARVVATLCGYSRTPPHLYHVVQLFVTSLGFGVLVWWLAQHQINKWMALCWLGNAGLLMALFNGLPDS